MEYGTSDVAAKYGGWNLLSEREEFSFLTVTDNAVL